MKRFLLLFPLWALTCVAYAQTVTVLNKETGEPVELATIFSAEPYLSATTNADGQANISQFAEAEIIEIRSIGYQSLTVSYQTISSEYNFEIKLTPSEVSLDQVVVSATKWNQSRRETPYKVTTITARDVALQNPQTAADMLGSSGEVFIQKSQQGGGSPIIRGFATNRLLMTIDGVRMNTAIFRSGNIQNVISLDPFAIESTEIFYGPGSVIYGSDAIGGVMSFYTLKPQLSLTDEPYVKGNAVARFASANNEYTGHFDVNVGWKKWALVTSYTHNTFGDLRMGSNGPDEYLRPEYVETVNGIDQVVRNTDPQTQIGTGYSQDNFMSKLRFKPNNNWDFTYAFHYSETSDYDRYDRLIRYRSGSPRSSEWYYGPQVWMMNNLEITNTKSNAVYDEMTIRLAQQYFEESRHDRDFGDSLLNNRREQVDAYSLNIDFTKIISTRHRLLYGVEGVINEINSTGNTEDIYSGDRSNAASRYPNSTWSSYAAYLTYQFKPSTQWTLQAGARYNYFAIDATFDTRYYPFPYESAELNQGALTGSLGADYSPNDSWKISANVSTGFRAPNIDDMGKVFDSEPGSVVVPNPDLDAEYAYNAELDIAKVFGNVFKVDVAGYYTILSNALVRRDYTLGGQDSIMYDGELSQVQAIQNAAEATVYGLQAGIEWKLPKGFAFKSQFNYQIGEEELDDGTTSPSRHAAPWFGVTHLTYNKSKLMLDLYAQYSGEVSYDDMPISEQDKDYMYAIDDDGNPYSPSWYTLNLKAMYQFTNNLSVSAGVENLTDIRYRPYSSGMVAAGRNFVLALRAKF